jgi:hypothetical protein
VRGELLICVENQQFAIRRSHDRGAHRTNGSENHDGSSNSRTFIRRTLVCGLWRMGPLPSSLIWSVILQTDLETEGRETVVAHRDDPQYRCMNIERKVKEVCGARPRPKPSAPSARRDASRKARNRLDR